MTKKEVAELVAEGFKLTEEIGPKEKRLKEIKGIIGFEADGNPAVFEGKGCKASVGYSSKPVHGIDPEDLEKVKKLSGEYFEKLFCWAPISKFRDVAKALLGEKAVSLIEATSGNPFPVVKFEAA